MSRLFQAHFRSLISRLDPRRSLQARLGLTIGGLALLFSGLSGMAIEEVIRRRSQEEVGQALAQLALQAADTLDRDMQERYREIQVLARLTRLNRLAEEDPTNLRSQLEALQISYPDYSWIGLANPQGTVVASTRGLLKGKSVAQRPWFQQAQTQPFVGEVHEAVLLAKLLPPAAEPLRLVDVAMPVMENNRQVGVLGAHLNWQWARRVRTELLKTAGQRSQLDIMILSAAGKVLLGPPEWLEKTVDLPSFEAARSGKQGYLLERFSQQNYITGFIQTRGYRDYPGLGWIVLVRQPTIAAFAPLAQMHDQLLGLQFVISGMFVISAWLLARRLTRPLMAIATAADQIHSLDPVPLHANTLLPIAPGQDEVARLSQSLNHLLTALTLRDQALHQSKLELEQRIEERTHELNQVNTQLQREIEKHQDLERSLQVYAAEVEDLYNNAPCGYHSLDAQGRMVRINDTELKWLGYEREDLIGTSFQDLLSPQGVQVFQSNFPTFKQQGWINNLEFEMRRKDGKWLTYNLCATAIRNETGEYIMSRSTIFDITEQRALARMKDEFIAVVSHELRTPLTAIRGALGLLAAGVYDEKPEKSKSMLQIASQQSDRLVRLVNDILDLGRLESGIVQLEFQCCDATMLIQQSVDTMRSSADLADINLVLRTESAWVKAAPDAIVQTLTNLLGNAIKFSPPQTQITVSTQSILSDAKPWIRFAIQDQGPGIPHSQLQTIFDRFQQVDPSDSREKGGTGLGLAICRQIVTQHGGKIWAESFPNQGSTFIFMLPSC